ncbi:hypothetical protein ACHAXR_010052 [Thalassiosira sp. AJA248-18]
MMSLAKNHGGFMMCLLGVSFCVNGFILERCSRPPLFLIKRQQPRCYASILEQTKQDLLYGDEYPTNIYPTDTLQNIVINSTQTLAPDIAYFYLQNTLGLSEETMWKITLEAGSILGMTSRNLERKVSLLRRTMNLSDEDVRVILGKQPAVLHYSADRNLAPTILFLVRALDLSKSELRSMVMDCPSILGYSLENLGKKIAFFRSLGYSKISREEDGVVFIRELIVGTPKLLLSAVDTGLVPRMKFMLNEIQFSVEDLRKVYQKNPRLLLYSLDGNLREKIVFFFILQLHMEPKHVRKILLSFPQIMDYNLENHMKPIAEYFMTELEFSAAELGRIIHRFPRLFSYSLFKIKHVAGFLRYELELDPRQAKRVIFQAPQVLGLDTEGNLKEKLDFLRNRLDLTSMELGLVFSKMPTLMCLGVESNLLPKLEYLGHVLLDQGQPDNHLLKETVLKQPTLLGYSLQGRIQPRMERLIDAGISPNKISVGISMSETNFQQWLSSSQARKISELDAVEQNFIAKCNIMKDLKFSKEEMDMICSELPEANDWNAPALAYLTGELGVSGADLKTAVLSYPMLLAGASRRKVNARLKQLHSAGLNVLDNLNTISWSDDKFDDWIKSSRSKIAFLQRELGLNITETDMLLSEMPSLQSTQASKMLKQKLKYFQHLTPQLNSSVDDLKQILLKKPQLLTLSLSKTIQPRMNMLLQSGCPPTDICKIAALSPRKAEEYCSKCYLFRRLGFSSKEMDSLVAYIGGASGSSSILRENVEYLLHHVFGDSKQILKTAIVQGPKLLKQSEQTIHSRAEILHYLESIGLGYPLSDITGFFTQSESIFTKGLLPKLKNWYPPVSEELEERHDGEDSKKNGVTKKNHILATLNDFPPTLAMAYSDESNREVARVVHWR